MNEDNQEISKDALEMRESDNRHGELLSNLETKEVPDFAENNETHARDTSFLNHAIAWSLESKSMDRVRKAKRCMMRRTVSNSVLAKGCTFLSNEENREMLVARCDLVPFSSKFAEREEEGNEKLACLLLA